ncbi:cysteine rich repeat-containing protein [Pseudomonadota bacterium]
MKRISTLFLLVMSFGLLTPALAAESVIESVAKGCEKELTKYCSSVTPGEGRVLACMYAHEDKLSGQCEFALYDAAAQLQRFVSALSYLANECAEDLDKHCAAVEAGEGRLAECLLKNKSKLQKRCVAAIEQTDLKVE